MNHPTTQSPNTPVKEFTVEALSVSVFQTIPELAGFAANEASTYLRNVLKENGSATVILATGNSQIAFLQQLVSLHDLPWDRVILFHMDEYLGLPADHSASFRKYMRERVQGLIKPRAFHFLEGDAVLPLDECARYEELLRAQPVDLCCLGIGENGHLAFNDPPVANFHDRRFVNIVKLDDDCKMQQVREGHFPNLEAVPPYAFTLTIPALCSARKMLCIAPEKRKAKAVRGTLEGPISTACPASILREQAHAKLLLDLDSASLLTR